MLYFQTEKNIILVLYLIVYTKKNSILIQTNKNKRYINHLLFIQYNF